MKKTHILWVLFSIFIIQCVQADDSSVNPECTFWNQLSKNLTNSSAQNGGAVHMACNSTCSSIACCGHFKSPTLMAQSFEFDFCFGLRLNHCENPATMDYYLQVPTMSINKTGSISHNDSLDIPGPKVMSVDSTVVIIVEMVRVNKSFLLFGINGRFRVGDSMFLDKEEKVFPPTYIDILPCKNTSAPKEPFTGPATFIPFSKVTTAATTAALGVTTKKPVINSKTYNKVCEIGVTFCSEHEMCQASNDMSKSGICVCDPESTFDGTSGVCASNIPATTKAITEKPTGSPSVTEAAHGKQAKNASVNMTAVIIGAVFGGLLLIVVLVSVIIFIGRRRRRADFRGRHQLLSDQDDDLATNVVI